MVQYIFLKRSENPTKVAALCLITGAALLAALPYLKNLILYGNPFWPIKVPFFSNLFPYTRDMDILELIQVPPPISYLNKFELFLHSLFEINHPTQYLHRPRWIIDQGNAWLAFRMGGFWYLGVITFLLYALTLPVIVKPRKGLYMALGLMALIGLSAFMPQSNELRYYMFLPLCWAAIIGIFFRYFERKHARAAVCSLLLFIGLFSYMVHENWPYYKIEKLNYRQLAHLWEADRYWPYLKRGTQYCAVGQLPIGLLLTGPTMKEFHIVDRIDRNLCPPDTVIIIKQY